MGLMLLLLCDRVHRIVNRTHEHAICRGLTQRYTNGAFKLTGS